MASMTYLVFGVSTLAFSVFLMVVLFRLRHIFSPNVILVMYVCHIAQQVAASIALMFDPEAVVASTYFVATAVTALLIPIGGLVGHIIVPVSPRDQHLFRQSTLSMDAVLRRKTWRFFVLYGSFCLVLFLSYVIRTDSIPVYGLVSGVLTPEAAQVARREQGAGSFGLIFGVGLRFFMPLLFLMGLLGLTCFRSGVSKFCCIAGVCIAIIYNGWAMDKTPVATLFLLAVLVMLLRKDEEGGAWDVKALIKGSKKILRKRKRRIYMLIVAFVLLSFAYPVFIFMFKPAAKLGLDYIVLDGVVMRLFYKPAYNTYSAFEAFSLAWDYTYFADIRKLAALFNWDYFDLSKKISAYKGLPATTNSPPAAIGNFYAQGGWPIVIGGVIFASALFKVIENLLWRMDRKNVVSMSLYALLLYNAFRFSWANFHTILMTEYIVPLLLILVAWRINIRIKSHRRAVVSQR